MMIRVFVDITSSIIQAKYYIHLYNVGVVDPNYFARVGNALFG